MEFNLMGCNVFIMLVFSFPWIFFCDLSHLYLTCFYVCCMLLEKLKFNLNMNWIQFSFMKIFLLYSQYFFNTCVYQNWNKYICSFILILWSSIFFHDFILKEEPLCIVRKKLIMLLGRGLSFMLTRKRKEKKPQYLFVV